ncbi:DUF2252 domain-containing protein [Mycobacterium aquaticum]|uniref:DUF2252 domain-containing protein n=1 Tax=Mycobacterium aquaticum TaxID=1927124 RepID=A0A1X0BCG8_9MYCO|nr:DUF2252 domain-containing protein [Mycobacterium aquaticum]ORA40003.1 hypothetical protein BST13_01185 [Mycobacterium aquaticum]
MSNQSLRERVIDIEDAEQDVARGRALRKMAPRRSLAQLVPSSRSATEILSEQNRNRVPELVPLRFARMLTDPFSFYRGTAAVMAADLATSPSSGVQVLCSGDAHLSNFGIYAAPDRELIFDLNDFDEAAVAPAEWDVKRLITSAIVGGRHAGYPEKSIRTLAGQAIIAYRDGLQTILDMSVLDRYYLRFEPERYRHQVSGCLEKVINRTARRARKRTSVRVFERIMAPGADGGLQLREDPPVLEHLDIDLETALIESFQEYLATVPADVALLLSHFRVTDMARRIVGVGSVGTRCYLVILTGPAGEPLILQVKEASTSVLEQYGGVQQPSPLLAAAQASGEGRRVVSGQRVLQAMSDVFLGTARADGRDFYVRQFQDMKGTIETEGMSVTAFGDYVSACALALARAHAQSANASVLRGYVGNGEKVSAALIEWSYSYADKSLEDFYQLRAAAKAGEIEVADDPAR